MSETVTLPRGELQRLLSIVELARRLRSVQDRVLLSDSTDEMLAAVQEEAQTLRALDRALAKEAATPIRPGRRHLLSSPRR